MQITRKRVRFGGIETFVDPRSDLVLDKKERVYLHYLPDGNGESRKHSAMRYQLVKYTHGFYIKYLGFFDFETAVKKYIKDYTDSVGDLTEAQADIRKAIRKMPYRAKEVFFEALNALNEANEPELPSPPEPVVEEDFTPLEKPEEFDNEWIGKIADSFSIDDYILEDKPIIKGKSGSDHRFDLVITSKGEEKERIAFLSDLSNDSIQDIMMFNALAEDCNIQLKVLSVDRDLGTSEVNLLNDYGISVYDKRSGEILELRQVSHDEDRLERIVDGAVGKGTVCMISGKTGVGKTLVSTQYLIQGAQRGEKGAILLTECRGAEFIESAKGYAPDFVKFYRNGTIQVIELSAETVEYKDIILESSGDFNSYVHRVSSEIRRFVENARIERLVIDSITPLIAPNKELINLLFSQLVFKDASVLVTGSARNSHLSAYGIEENCIPNLIKLEGTAGLNDVIRAEIIRLANSPNKPEPYYFKITDLVTIGPAGMEADSTAAGGSYLSETLN